MGLLGSNSFLEMTLARSGDLHNIYSRKYLSPDEGTIHTLEKCEVVPRPFTEFNQPPFGVAMTEVLLP